MVQSPVETPLSCNRQHDGLSVARYDDHVDVLVGGVIGQIQNIGHDVLEHGRHEDDHHLNPLVTPSMTGCLEIQSME